MLKWNKNLFLRKRRTPTFHLFSFIIVCLLGLLMIEGFFYLERRLRPALISIAEVKADILATDAINRAIMEEVARGILYQDLITIRQDEQGRIVVAQINTMEINRLMAETTIATQNALVGMGRESIKIPIGEVLDNYLLAAYGPKIPVKLIPAGRVNTFLVDLFEEAGINQVRHRIYLDVVTEVRIVIPFMGTKVEVHTTVPLAEAIYPGEVPETVINLNLDSLSVERVFN